MYEVSRSFVVSQDINFLLRIISEFLRRGETFPVRAPQGINDGPTSWEREKLITFTHASDANLGTADRVHLDSVSERFPKAER